VIAFVRRLALAAVARQRLLAAAGWPILVGLLLVFATLAALPAASAIAVGALVGRLVGLTAAHGASVAQAVPAVVALGGLILLGHLAEHADDLLRFAAQRRIDGHVRQEVRQVALAWEGIENLENSKVQNDLAAAVDGWLGQTPGAGAIGRLWLVFRFVSAFAATFARAGLSRRPSGLSAVRRNRPLNRAHEVTGGTYTANAPNGRLYALNQNLVDCIEAGALGYVLGASPA